MIKRKYRIAYLIYSFVETCITFLAFVIAYFLRKQLPSPYFGRLFPFSDYIALLVVVILLWNLLSALIRANPAGIATDPLDAVKEVALTVLTGSVLISAAIFILKYDFISRPFILIFALVNFVFLCGFRVYAKAGVSRFRNVLDGELHVLIVGTDEKAARVAEVLEEAKEWGYKLKGIVRESP